MTNRRAFVLCAIGAAAALTVTAAAPALADASPLGTSYAAAVNVNPGAGLTATTTQTGDIAGLLGFLSPVEDQFVAPLSTALSGLPARVVSDLQATLGSSLVANSATDSQTAPADGTFPDCSTGGWAAGNCYTAADVDGASGAVAQLDVSVTQGWAAADATAASAAARTEANGLRVLGVALGDLGTAGSTERCAANGTCTGSSSLAGLSLLDGAVRAKVDNGTLQVAVGTADYAAAADVHGQVVTGGGQSAQVTAQGNTVKVAVSLSLDQLTGLLGVSDDLSGLNATADAHAISLDVFLTAGSAGADGRSTGLQVGLGVSADVNASVAGLVGDELQVNDAGGDLAQLQLAYTTATAPPSDGGAGGVPDGAPPQLI